MHPKILFVFVMILFGLSAPYLFRYLAAKPPVVSEQELEVRRRKAQNDFEAINDSAVAGDFAAARKALKSFQVEFGNLKTNTTNDTHGSETYGDLAHKEEKFIDCLEHNVKTGTAKSAKDAQKSCQQN